MIKNKQSSRSLIAFLVTWAFVILMITGIVLYIVPQGRIAYWVHWSLWGLEKAQWGNLHMMFGGVFILTGIWHLYYNWKPFKKYLLERAKGRLQIKQELVVSLSITGAILVMSILNIPPVSWVFDLNQEVKDAWVTRPELDPPFGHAEELSLKAITRRMDLDYKLAVESLTKAGLKFQGDESLETIARENALNPMQVYGLFSQLKQPAKPVDYAAMTAAEIEAHFAGTGLGRKRLGQVSEQIGLDQGVAIERLAAQGIEGGPQQTLRELAEAHGVSPIDILKLMLEDTKSQP